MLNILLLVSDNKCLIPATVYSPSRSWFSYWESITPLLRYLQSLPFLAPRPRRLRMTGSPGLNLNLHCKFFALPFPHEVLGSSAFSFKLCLMPCLLYKKYFQTCPKHKRLLVEQTGGKFADWRARNNKRHQDIVSDHLRYVQRKPSCFIATFEYVIGWKDFTCFGKFI